MKVETNEAFAAIALIHKSTKNVRLPKKVQEYFLEGKKRKSHLILDSASPLEDDDGHIDRYI